MFLHEISVSRTVMQNATRSGMVKHYFHIVLNALIDMQDHYLKQSTGKMDTTNEIRNNNRMSPYFKVKPYCVKNSLKILNMLSFLKYSHLVLL